MKKLLVILISLILTSSIYAGDFAKLRMKIAGPIKDNRYFLCVSGIGCVSILNGNKGRAFPLHSGSISTIRTVNAANMSFRAQQLPRSCNVSVNSNQTLTVMGRIIEGSNNNFALTGLRCSVR